MDFRLSFSLIFCIIFTKLPQYYAKHKVPTSARLITANGQVGHPFGRVEVYHDGVWGSVCSDVWTHENAKVLCRMIGYHSDNAVAVPSGLLGVGTNAVVLSGLRCKGHESNIDKCPHSAWYGNSCDHAQDAGVICSSEIVKGRTAKKLDDVDYCADLVTSFREGPIPVGQLCQPHGYCISTKTGAVCMCEYGYNGEFCQYATANELYQSIRCALYPTDDVARANVTVGCPSDQNCIPDRIHCSVLNACSQPFGWCLPYEEYDKYMKYAKMVLNN